MNWWKWVKIILECLTVIGPVLKITKLEKTVEVLSTGVEAFSKEADNLAGGKRVKACIKAVAEAAGVEEYLHKKVKEFTALQWKKLF